MSMEQVIASLLSENNDIRVQAENVFNDAKKQPNEMVIALMTVIATSPQMENRGLGLVMLKRVLLSESLWPQLQPQLKVQLKQQFLQMVEADPPQLRHKVANLVGGVAAHVFEKENGDWAEFIPFLLKCSKSQGEGHREVALLMLSDLAVAVGKQFRNNFDMVKMLLNDSLNDPHSLKVRIAGLTATANFLQVLDADNEQQFFQQLLPSMLGVISAALNNNDEETAQGTLELFVDLTEVQPTFFRPHIQMVAGAMLQIANAFKLETSTRHLAVEFLTSLSEHRPGLIRKIPGFMDQMLPVLIRMIANVEDDEDWNQSTDEDDEDETTDPYAGEQALDRFSMALGGKQLVPAMMKLIGPLLQSPDWKLRHAALMCISVVGEGSYKQYESLLVEIVKNVTVFLRDAHPRVRWAACNTIGQMCTDFGPELQTSMHELVMPSLIGVMDDNNNQRVQSHAAAAVINFCEHCPKHILAIYLEGLLSKLVQLLQTGKRVVQEQAITAIAAVADCAEGEFVKYYDTFVPSLIQLLSNANGKDYRLLRGKAVECISLIGVAVGKDKFAPDAKRLMDIMLQVQTSKLEADDPQANFFLQAWGRIASALGDEFLPYLSYVMPSILQSAGQNPDIKIAGEEETVESDEEQGYDFVNVGDKQIGIRTSTLEEKATACQMLLRYATQLKAGFYPYVEEVVKMMVPLMKFYYHDDVRACAVSIMPALIESGVTYFQKSGAATGADKQFARNLFNFMFPTFLESAQEEEDPELVHSLLEAWSATLVAVDDTVLTEEQIKQSLDQLIQIVHAVIERRLDRNNKRKEPEFDEEDDEVQQDEEELDGTIMCTVADVLGKIAKYHKQAFFNQATEVLQIFQQMLQPKIGKSVDVQASICLFDDLIEFCGLVALQALSSWFPLVLNNALDNDPGVRQAAVYGLGVVVNVAQQHIQQYIPAILEKLVAAITTGDMKKFGVAADNAISSVGKIITTGMSDNTKLIPLWLSWFPITHDDVESKVIYGQLCSMIESSNPILLGANLERLPKILSVFAHALGSDYVDDALNTRMLTILHQMQAKLPAQLQAAAASLSVDDQRKLQTCLSNYRP